MLAATLLVVTGCGIRPTDAVDAGDPPSGIATAERAAAAAPVGVYFVKTGKVIRVARPATYPAADSSPVTDPITAALYYLLVGPDPEEFQAGMTTALPPTVDPLSAHFRPAHASTDSQVLVVDKAPAELPILAQQQLNCTIREVTGNDFAGQPLRFDNGSGTDPTLSECPPGILPKG